jgi:hypothetical protein
MKTTSPSRVHLELIMNPGAQKIVINLGGAQKYNICGLNV